MITVHDKFALLVVKATKAELLNLLLNRTDQGFVKEVRGLLSYFEKEMKTPEPIGCFYFFPINNQNGFYLLVKTTDPFLFKEVKKENKKKWVFENEEQFCSFGFSKETSEAVYDFLKGYIPALDRFINCSTIYKQLLNEYKRPPEEFELFRSGILTHHHANKQAIKACRKFIK